MKMHDRLAHHAPNMTTNPIDLFHRAPRSDSKGKRDTQQTSRRAFDPIAYAAALEVLG